MAAAAASYNEQEKKLLDMFDEAYKTYKDLTYCEEPTNSVCIQNKVKKAMRTLEEATRLTSLCGIFSRNENVEEVATDNLRLFLLPALLGTLALKLTGSTNRIEIVQASDTYFRDFLERCNQYEICSIEIPPPVDADCGKEDEPSSNASVSRRPMFDLGAAARNRARKIARFKEEKSLESELDQLELIVNSDTVNDEVKRDYFIKLIKLFVSRAEEELDCLQSEKMILAHMKAVQKTETMAASEEIKRKGRIPPKPLQAVIITKDEVQKAVFGAGYPSLPTMTVQEFYDKRVEDGIFPNPVEAGLSLQKMASQGTNMAELEEKDIIDRERRLEVDDETELERQRAMDEFKDDNKRGAGNRYNRS